MILFNQELGEKDCEFNVDSNTKQFLISFFGFYRHDISKDFYEFLTEIGIKEIVHIENNKKPFQLNGSYSLEAYNACDRRSFDLTLVLPKVFYSVNDAIEWFNTKVKDSEYIKKSEINEVQVLDADKLFNFINQEFEYNEKVEIISKEVIKKINEFKMDLLDDLYKDPKYANNNDYKAMIKNTINNKFDLLK